MFSFDGKTIVRYLNSACLRITFNRLTTSFFLLSLSFFLAQLLIQAVLWNEDNSAYNVIHGLLEYEHVPLYLLPLLHNNGNHYNYRVCSAAPYNAKNVTQICPLVYDSITGPNSDWMPPPGFQPYDMVVGGDMNSSAQVDLLDKDTVLLDDQCVYTLLYPAEQLLHSQSEELALIFSQLWLLGISSSAIISRSVSHIIALFSMRVLSTAWSAYTLWRTTYIESIVDHLIVAGKTPCHTGLDVFPDYFKTRLAFQIPDLVLNACALLFTGIIGHSLLKTFSENTFNCVGPPARIVRIYRYMLTVSVCGQLLFFLEISSISLALKEGIISGANLLALDIALFIATIILTLTMVILGYRATRYEQNRQMIAVFVILGIFIFGSLGMLIFPTIRFLLVHWPFLACVSGISVAVLICYAVFSVLCRIHFGEGLSHYLHVEKVLSDQDFEPDEFSTDRDDKSSWKVGRQSFTVQNAMPTTPLVTRNANWDFDSADEPRVPIYTVSLEEGRPSNQTK